MVAPQQGRVRGVCVMHDRQDAQPDPLGGRRLHQLVAAARRALEKANTDTYGMLVNYGTSHLDMTVSPSSLQRALLFWQAILEACEREAWKVAVEKEGAGKTRVLVEGEWLVLRLRETYRQEQFMPTSEELREAKRRPYAPSWPRTRFTPSGVFEFTVKGADHGWDLVRARDGKTRVDGSLDWLIPSLRDAAAKNRVARDERQRRDEEARKAEQRRLEAERRRADEEQRRNELLQETDRWHRSRRLREYLAAIRQAMGDAPDETALHAWLKWAEAFAGELDPLPRRTTRAT